MMIMYESGNIHPVSVIVVNIIINKHFFKINRCHSPILFHTDSDESEDVAFLFFRHFSLQYFTSSQFLFHFFRQLKGSPQTSQILDGNPEGIVLVFYFWT